MASRPGGSFTSALSWQMGPKPLVVMDLMGIMGWKWLKMVLRITFDVGFASIESLPGTLLI